MTHSFDLLVEDYVEIALCFALAYMEGSFQLFLCVCIDYRKTHISAICSVAETIYLHANESIPPCSPIHHRTTLVRTIINLLQLSRLLLIIICVTCTHSVRRGRQATKIRKRTVPGSPQGAGAVDLGSTGNQWIFTLPLPNDIIDRHIRLILSCTRERRLCAHGRNGIIHK